MTKQNFELVTQLLPGLSAGSLLLLLQRIMNHPEAVDVYTALQIFFGFEDQIQTSFGDPA